MDVLPAVTETTWEPIAEKLKLLAGLTEWVHVDLADNTISATTTFLEVPKFALIAKQFSFEAHLLSSQPEKYVRQLADAGFRRVIAHVEADDPRLFLSQANYEDMEVGIALDLNSDLELIEPFLEEVDFAVVLGTEAGASGGQFQPESLEKIRRIRNHFPDLPIEAAGGINETTAKLVADAGATRIVSDSYLWRDVGVLAKTLDNLRNAD